MNPDDVTRKILSMVENGDITAEEGLRLLNSVASADDLNMADADENVVAISPYDDENSAPILAESTVLKENQLTKFKKWWVLPFSVGLILTVISSIWMYLGYSSKGFGWGFWLSWIPFIIGIVIMTISALSSKSKWIHIRVKEKGIRNRANINLSLPLPLNAARWILKIIPQKNDRINNAAIQEILSEIEHGTAGDNPLYVHVSDDGDEVEIFIG